MDLIGGYLLVILILFVANISLLLGNFKIGNMKLLVISFAVSLLSFGLMYVSGYLGNVLSFLNEYYSFFFMILSVLLFMTFLCYFRNNNLRFAISSVSILFVIALLGISSQSQLSLFGLSLYSLFGFLVLFLVYQLTKLLVHAKREFPVIIGEYMCLFSMLLFIFGLTYESTRTLVYSMFSPFLILTPTYQLIYIIIGIIVVLVIGVVYNDNKGGSL